MKKLIIVAHPDLSKSVVNKRWAEELRKAPDDFEVRDLYAEYPDWKIDVKKEQALIEKFDTVVFQFPMYWYSCPPLLSKYFDDVFTYGWAYGSTGDKLKGKTFAVAVSTGSDASVYSAENHGITLLDSLMTPFRATAAFCGMKFGGYFTLNGCLAVKTEVLEANVRDYIEFLKSL